MMDEKEREEIIAKIENAWEESDPLRHGSYGLKAEWEDDHLVISGYTRSNTLKAMAMALARHAVDDSVPMECKIVSDEELEILAAEALACSPETKDLQTHLRIDAFLGEVFLHATALDEEDIQHAVSVVKELPEPRDVKPVVHAAQPVPA